MSSLLAVFSRCVTYYRRPDENPEPERGIVVFIRPTTLNDDISVGRSISIDDHCSFMLLRVEHCKCSYWPMALFLSENVKHVWNQPLVSSR